MRRRIEPFLGAAIIIACIILIYSLLPLTTALQFGGDEGYQVMTGFMMHKGYTLYHQIWNDQPPLHVLLLRYAFDLWGASLSTARLISAAFGVSFFVLFFQVIKVRNGLFTALSATLLLICSPIVLELSISVMQEVPAFALALLAVLFLSHWSQTARRHWLVASGLVMGAAIGIKFTVLLLVPSIGAEILLTGHKRKKAGEIKFSALNIVTWGLATIIIFGLIELFWGSGSLISCWKSHFSKIENYSIGTPDDFPLNSNIFLDHAEVVILALVGLVAILRSRAQTRFAFPLILLATALMIHLKHKPWWNYYYLHFAIPLTWLAGHALSLLMRKVFDSLTALRHSQRRNFMAYGIVVLIATSVALVRSERRLEAEVLNLRKRNRTDKNQVLSHMREAGAGAEWIYVEYGYEIYPFCLRLKMPPEITMVTLKRFWSNQISVSEIVIICREYMPSLILMKNRPLEAEWVQFLSLKYSVAYKNDEFVLYRLNKDADESSNSHQSLVQKYR